MIFAHTLNQVLMGKKSQTRRIVKPNEQFVFTGTVSRVVGTAQRAIYQVGKSYAIQPGRGKKAVARMVLTGIRQETVESITEDDAIAEGFISRAAFIETWRSIHGIKADLTTDVWVLEFQLECATGEDLEAIHERRQTKDGCPDYSHDLSSSLTGTSRSGLHGWNHPDRAMGTTLPH